jgi:hypothetical protein
MLHWHLLLADSGTMFGDGAIALTAVWTSRRKLSWL